MHRTKLIIALFILTALSMASFAHATPDKSSCDGCHSLDMPTTWITVTVDSETKSDITYYVNGSDNYNGKAAEGWAVFDPSDNNVANGYNDGYFTLPKDGQTYRVYWVDDEDPGKGGSAYEDVTTPPPSVPEFPLGLEATMALSLGAVVMYVWWRGRSRIAFGERNGQKPN